jgi:hypothetical protein
MRRFLCLIFLLPAGLPQSGFSQTYTTRFEETEDPLSEGGKWVNQGIDWTRIRKTNGIACGTQSGTNTGIYQYDDSYAHLSGFPPDQEAWGEVFIAKPQAPCIQEVEILLRWTSSPHRTTGYECFARCVSGGSSYVQIVRWEGPLGKFTYLADLRGTNYGLKSGDVLKASVIGNLIRVYINGVEKARATDNTYKTGNPGIGEFLYCDNRQGIGSNSDFGFSSFAARGLGGTSQAQTNAAAHTPLHVTPRNSLCSTKYFLVLAFLAPDLRYLPSHAGIGTIGRIARKAPRCKQSTRQRILHRRHAFPLQLAPRHHGRD